MGTHKIESDLLIHDVKGPLAVAETSIRMLLEQGEKYGPLTARQEKALNRALRNVLTARRRVVDALEVGAAEAGSITEDLWSVKDLLLHSLIEVLEPMDNQIHKRLSNAESLAETRGILKEKSIFLHISCQLWEARFQTDGPKVEQIFRNLLGNALKHRKSQIAIAMELADEHALFSVADDGNGIAPEFHRKIFESYFQIPQNDAVSERGHGLGLAGAMILAERLGGGLELESDVGSGARFIATIPMVIR